MLSVFQKTQNMESMLVIDISSESESEYKWDPERSTGSDSSNDNDREKRRKQEKKRKTRKRSYKQTGTHSLSIPNKKSQDKGTDPKVPKWAFQNISAITLQNNRLILMNGRSSLKFISVHAWHVSFVSDTSQYLSQKYDNKLPVTCGDKKGVLYVEKYNDSRCRDTYRMQLLVSCWRIILEHLDMFITSSLVIE